MAFYFKNTEKDIIVTEKDEEDYRNINICRFCEAETISDKVKNQCHLTGKYRNTEGLLIVNVILMLHKNNVIFSHLCFTVLLITIVLCSSRNWLIRRMIKWNLIIYLRQMKNILVLLMVVLDL